jgi:hypothetical protein
MQHAQYKAVTPSYAKSYENYSVHEAQEIPHLPSKYRHHFQANIAQHFRGILMSLLLRVSIPE